MKILLLAASCENPVKSDFSYPIALGYLGAVLKNKGHSVKAFDLIEYGWEAIESKVRLWISIDKPDVIGISSMTSTRASSFKLANLIKSINPNIKVIFGGVHPTIMYEQILRNFPVDFVVIGEGEETIVELVDAIKKKSNPEKLKKIKGIAFKVNNEVVKTEIRPFIKNLDSLPLPDHSYFKDRILADKTIYISSARGCPYACKFCSTSGHWGRMVRQRSVKEVISEIKQLKKEYPSVNKIIFNDNEFLINPVWVKEFCEAFIKENLNMTWWAAGRVTSVNEEVVSLLKRAGCYTLALGVESGSPKILASIDKKINQEQIINAFAICKKYHLNAGMFLMVGLPGENRQTVNETIDLIRRTSFEEELKFIGLPGLFQVFPGNSVYDLAKEQGFINDEYWLSDKPVPFYTYEHSRFTLLFWSFKIAFFYSLYHGSVLELFRSEIKTNLRFDKLKRAIKRYFI
jgi:radical SAM superfamily enzyme YgiQ (UPF0313 family)